MFRKIAKTAQLNIFTSLRTLFSGNALRFYEDRTAWHNLFREQVTMRINESTFSPLYCANNGTPNALIRILIAMMILKEAEGLSDQKFFENCRFNVLTRSEIGLFDAAGSYHSPGNQMFCKENEMNLYLHAIQGAKGRYQFIVKENGDITIFDTKTNQLIEPYKLICKNNTTKWRFDTGNDYRYFTQNEVDTYQIRKQITETPVKIFNSHSVEKLRLSEWIQV